MLESQRQPAEQRVFRLSWSRFRRKHQAGARRSHQQRRACQAPLARSNAPQALVLLGLPRLTDGQWEHICPFLPPQRPATGRPAQDHPLVVEGIVYVMRSGCSWRSLPARLGPWQTIASRYQRWCKEGLWEPILAILQTPEGSLPSSA
jgi:Putative transposase of IS4/5 family (DUF4096)